MKTGMCEMYEEAECSVLGSALLDQEAVKLVVDLQSENFGNPKHVAILNAIKAVEKEGYKVDLVTVTEELKKQNQMDAIGGPTYLTKLCDMTPTTANVKSYIALIREATARRRLKAIGEELINSSVDGTVSVNEIREKAALSIRDVRTGRGVRLISQQEALLSAIDGIDKAQKQKGANRIQTGIEVLDRNTGGLDGSKLVVIGARPSVGKSAFAMAIAINAAKAGRRVLYVSLEMEPDEIMQRQIAEESQVRLTEITGTNISQESWIKISEAIGPLSERKIIYSTEGDTVEKVRESAFCLYENDGIDLIIVDYLQLMDSGKKRTNRQEEVADISRGLKKLAQELNIPIIALSQLNRASAIEKRPPTMSDARESGAIEQDANIFILLHDPEPEEISDEFYREAAKNLRAKGMKLLHVNVDKNRQGRTGSFHVAFDGDRMQFLTVRKEGENDEKRGATGQSDQGHNSFRQHGGSREDGRDFQANIVQLLPRGRVSERT